MSPRERGGRLWTIGHSSHSLDAVVAWLRSHGVERLIDVRTVPQSRRFPHFDAKVLADRLPRRRIDYVVRKDLGGKREPLSTSTNAGLREVDLRAFADFMASETFATRLRSLETEARVRPSALFCAESDPWRCHRSLIADALTVRGWEVHHIRGEGEAALHELHAAARVGDDGVVRYPGLV